MPTVDLPGMRSMSTDSACIARQRSSARLVILLYFTPASGLNSNVVTTGPGWICATCPSTANSRHFSSSCRADSISSRSSIFCSAFAGSSSESGGSVNAPCRRGVFCGSGSGSGSGGAIGAALFLATTGGASGCSPADSLICAASAVLACFATTSRRAFCLRRSSSQARMKPTPRADRSRDPWLALANIRPNENCVERITASTISVNRTMMEPVRLRYSANQAPSHAPSEPPASNVLPATSALPNTRLRNELLQPTNRPMPIAFV